MITCFYLVVQINRVHVVISESLDIEAENDGGLKNMEVKGELSISVNDPVFQQCSVHISRGENKEFQFKVLLPNKVMQ